MLFRSHRRAAEIRRGSQRTSSCSCDDPASSKSEWRCRVGSRSSWKILTAIRSNCLSLHYARASTRWMRPHWTTLLFHLEASGRRPVARCAGGRVGAHPPPHPDRGKRVRRELRGGRVSIHQLRRREGFRVVNLYRVARGAADVRPVEGDRRAGAEARVSRGTDERGRGQWIGGRRGCGHRCDGQCSRAA